MLVSLVGTQMQNAAIDWHVWVLTRSPLALGVGTLIVVAIVAARAKIVREYDWSSTPSTP